MQLSEEGSQKSEFFDEEEEFSSFSSNGNVQESLNTIDDKGFKVHQTYKQKDLQMPQIPAYLPKLYEIYMNNLQRKKQLTLKIEELKSKQAKLLRMKVDKETQSIQEFIDIQEDSPQVQESEKRYKEREQELKKLQKKYQNLKIMSVEGMMKKDKVIKNAVEKFVSDCKEICGSYVAQNKVFILTKQKLRLKKNIKNSLTHLESVRKSKSSEQSQEGQEKEHHQNYKYVIRSFKFFEDKVKEEEKQKVKKLISFSPIQKLSAIGLMSNDNYKGLVFDKKNRFYVFGDCKLVQIPSGKHIMFDKNIIFCKIVRQKLYIGTVDNILRIYEILEEEIKLRKIISCHYEEDSTLNSFSISRIPGIILFVQNGNKLCEMNTQTHLSRLLSQLPEKVQFFNEKMIVTENMVYKDYYSISGNTGKVSLVHNELVKKQIGKRNILDTTTFENGQFLIINDDKGDFNISSFSKKQ